MSAARRELGSRQRTPPRVKPDARYLELRVRRPASFWPVLRLASVAAAGALWVALLLRPRTGLFVFWSLLVPLLPLFFMLAPGLWRNLCPMAAANQLPRVSRLTRGLPLPRWLERHGYAVAVLLFVVLATSRKLGLEGSGVAVAALVGGSMLLATVGGAVFRGKSAFCGGICPLRPTQGLFGQTPPIKVAPSHCRPCVGCTPNCTDLEPSGAFVAELADPDPYRGAYRRLFAGALPGFTVAFFTGPAVEAAGVAAVLGQIAAFSLASLGAFFVLDQLAARAAPGATTAVFAASAFGLFYWFNVPVVATALARLLGGEPPAWAVWEGRLALAALALAWLVGTLRKQGRLARAAQGTEIGLPIAPAAPAGTPNSPSVTGDLPGAVAEGQAGPPRAGTKDAAIAGAPRPLRPAERGRGPALPPPRRLERPSHQHLSRLRSTRARASAPTPLPPPRRGRPRAIRRSRSPTAARPRRATAAPASDPEASAAWPASRSPSSPRAGYSTPRSARACSTPAGAPTSRSSRAAAWACAGTTPSTSSRAATTSRRRDRRSRPRSSAWGYPSTPAWRARHACWATS